MRKEEGRPPVSGQPSSLSRLSQVHAGATSYRAGFVPARINTPLMYDGLGFWLCHKRLSQGRFPWRPAAADGAAQQLPWNYRAAVT
jgi:hypothetical protein